LVAMGELSVAPPIDAFIDTSFLAQAQGSTP